ncbi:MAG: T9SS type A sorting domain-containing protein [Phaeodactylibacter sp.]|nr:T9SS type A sorting domain-containing protein [Phaeodactylibacter sp.]MCB9304156.1 T9SS type A sorting domain-containing protein [Lewinellaceae bacterium]
MIQRKLLFLLFAILPAALTFGQLTLRITDIPNNTPVGDNIYVAGSFNGWDSGNAAYILQHQGGEVYEITIDPAPGTVEFKFTRGDWQRVEGNASGAYLPNRTLEYTGNPQTEELQVLSWEDLGGNSGSTAADNVSVISQNFYIPQLDRYRRVWIYLPPDYDTSGRDYPVLYMQDGQNVFDATTSFSGEWEVDESLNQLFGEGDGGIIVVAIDNGGGSRIDEYSPWVNPNYGGGQGGAYVDFMVETLKPYIDENYRTLPGREHTGIMGSSLGGLISMYAAIEHQDVFSKAGIFSAAFWFADECYAHVAGTGKEEDMRFYLIAGQLEGTGGEQVADMFAMYNTLLAAGFSEDEVRAIAHADGQHSEWYWAREFPDAYEWLFRSESTDIEQPSTDYFFLAFPNPADSQLQVKTKGLQEGLRYEIFSLKGVVVKNGNLKEGAGIPLKGLPSGPYFIAIYREGQIQFVQRFLKR